MQGSKSNSFVKRIKQHKRFDDGTGKRHDNKKQEFHRMSRHNGNQESYSLQGSFY